LIVVLSGCYTSRVLDDAPNGIAVATGTGELVTFHSDGEAVDELSNLSSRLEVTEATALGLRHDPELQASGARLRSALADAGQARAIPNPVLSVAFRFPGGAGKPVIEAGLVAELISILQQPRRASAADHRLRAAAAEVLTTALDVVANVQGAYVEAQALDAELSVLNERQQLIDRLLTLARSRVELGESPRLDVLTIQSERLALDVEIAEKHADRRARRLLLARMIGQPGGSGEWELDSFVPVLAVPTNEPAWVAVALENRPEVQARQWELAAVGDDAALARFGPFNDSEIGVDAERDEDWEVGPSASVPLPIFDWGHASRQKADAAVVEARHQLVQTRRQVVQDVRQAMDALVRAQQALEIVRVQLLPLQQQRIEQAEAAYTNGLADITAVLIAEQESQESRQKLIELQQKVASAQYRLHRAAGGRGVTASLPTSRPSSLPTSQPTNQGQS
jgi:cobalt-zinc-cadmium efflux system outer membrane protein